MDSPLDQARYQVRFDWGQAGRRRLAEADIEVLVDVLAPAAEGAHASDPETAAADAAGSALVLHADLRTAVATAEAIITVQRERGARTSVNVIALGEPDGAELRFAVEDLLGAGAVIDALSARGIDHTSPEAAAAAEAFAGLRGAVRHLLSASASGQALIAAGREEEVRAAGSL